MTAPAFTVLLPVNRPPALLSYAIASVLVQERQDFELFVICDGAPPETIAVAREHAVGDPRIRVFAHPKGERHGEIYRDQALRDARGTLVCQLGDDDLWLPNHLSEIATLMDALDFGNLAQVEVMPDGTLELLAGDLADAETRQAIIERPCNFFGPTVTAYRLAAYRALPAGWTPAPADLPTDLFMWRKFLAQDHLRFGTRVAVTSIKFSAQYRRGWPMEKRREEIAAWVARIATPAERGRMAQAALLRLSHSVSILDRHAVHMDWIAKQHTDRIAHLEQELQASRAALQLNALEARRLRDKMAAVKRTWSWRLTRPLRKLARRLTRWASS